jgi:signal transduction histidine kinase
MDLSPATLHQAGLITALDWLSRQIKEQFGLHMNLDIDTELLMVRTPQKVSFSARARAFVRQACRMELSME